jgi:hypothetical protein
MEASGQLHTQAAVPRGKNPTYLLMRLNGTHSLSGHFGQDQNVLSLLGIQVRTIQLIDKSLIRLHFCRIGHLLSHISLDLVSGFSEFTFQIQNEACSCHSTISAKMRCFCACARPTRYG